MQAQQPLEPCVTNTQRPPPSIPIVVEGVLAGIVLASLGYLAWQFHNLGYLPHPFQSNTDESLMDFFNTAYWSYRKDAYLDWHTVYLPAAFLFVRGFTQSRCYGVDAYAARTCDPGASALIAIPYLLNFCLVFLSFRKSGHARAIARTTALCLGLPMLYGLELGNLIIPCFTFFVAAFGGLVRSERLRWFLIAMSINLKLYLLVLALPRLAAREWRWIWGTGILGMIIYLATYIGYGVGSPVAVVRDLLFYAEHMPNQYAMQNHFSALASTQLNAWNHIFPLLIYSGQAGVAACYAATLTVKRAISTTHLTILILTLLSTQAALHTSGYSADYTQVFLIFMIFWTYEKGPASLMLVIPAYLLCISTDVQFSPAIHSPVYSYWSQRWVMVKNGVALSQFARPALLLFIQYVLIGQVMRGLLWPQHKSREDVAVLTTSA